MVENAIETLAGMVKEHLCSILRPQLSNWNIYTSNHEIVFELNPGKTLNDNGADRLSKIYLRLNGSFQGLQLYSERSFGPTSFYSKLMDRSYTGNTKGEHFWFTNKDAYKKIQGTIGNITLEIKELEKLIFLEDEAKSV